MPAYGAFANAFTNARLETHAAVNMQKHARKRGGNGKHDCLKGGKTH